MLPAIKTILFPTDFSDRANKALSQVVGLAEKFSAKMIIYHAYHRPSVPGGTPEQLAKDLIELEKHLDLSFKDLLRQNPNMNEIDYEFRKELGVSIENIVRMSHEDSIDIIVMATKGARGFDELWGTKTAKIIKSVDIPVLVIPDNTKLGDMKKAGIICDYSKETDYTTLDFLVSMLQKLHLDADVITLNRSEKVMTNEEMAYRQLVRKKLESVPTTFHFTFNGHIDDGIIHYALDNDIGLVAILPKSYSFIESMFHESLTRQMAFHSPVPLLVLK